MEIISQKNNKFNQLMKIQKIFNKINKLFY